MAQQHNSTIPNMPRLNARPQPMSNSCAPPLSGPPRLLPFMTRSSPPAVRGPPPLLFRLPPSAPRVTIQSPSCVIVNGTSTTVPSSNIVISCFSTSSSAIPPSMPPRPFTTIPPLPPPLRIVGSHPVTSPLPMPALRHLFPTRPSSMVSTSSGTVRLVMASTMTPTGQTVVNVRPITTVVSMPFLQPNRPAVSVLWPLPLTRNGLSQSSVVASTSVVSSQLPGQVRVSSTTGRSKSRVNPNVVGATELNPIDVDVKPVIGEIIVCPAVSAGNSSSPSPPVADLPPPPPLPLQITTSFSTSASDSATIPATRKRYPVTDKHGSFSLLNMGTECLHLIFRHLDTVSLLRASQVCRVWLLMARLPRLVAILLLLHFIICQSEVNRCNN